jgi:periplasmic divalent cation tolerance protein
MKPTLACVIALVTAPDLETARLLARAALEARLIACANLVPKIESHYWWQGKIEHGSETLLVLKTTRRRVAALKKLILKQHPYDTAEFVVLPMTAGSAKYLNWVRACVR